jgi:Flp pilus assembly protein TadG
VTQQDVRKRAEGEPGRKRAESRGRARKRGTEGAVMVEFLAVFFPVFGFFLGLVQLMYVHTANMITKHSAYVAVRAAVVVIPDDPSKAPGGVNNATGARKEEVERAARVPLSTLGVDRGDVNVELDRSTYGRDDTVTVTVTVEYGCRVPLGNLIACGGNSKTLAAQATMPNQGVDWTY